VTTPANEPSLPLRPPSLSFSLALFHGDVHRISRGLIKVAWGAASRYNYTESTYFSLRKNRPLHQILGTAREVIPPPSRSCPAETGPT
jgi:hypothetical protein